MVEWLGRHCAAVLMLASRLSQACSRSDDCRVKRGREKRVVWREVLKWSIPIGGDMFALGMNIQWATPGRRCRWHASAGPLSPATATSLNHKSRLQARKSDSSSGPVEPNASTVRGHPTEEITILIPTPSATRWQYSPYSLKHSQPLKHGSFVPL